MFICYTLGVDGGWFDWDEGNEWHVLDHGVDPLEVEEALLDPHGAGGDARNVSGENREALIGATEFGRILHIVYTMRGEKVRPITARNADATEKRRYRGRRR